jgi:hypothetical protein
MLKRSRWHKSVTEQRIMEGCEARISTLGNPGICLACGADSNECEPDARNYICEDCGEAQVFGIDELLFMVA